MHTGFIGTTPSDGRARCGFYSVVGLEDPFKGRPAFGPGLKGPPMSALKKMAYEPGLYENFVSVILSSWGNEIYECRYGCCQESRPRRVWSSE